MGCRRRGSRQKVVSFDVGAAMVCRNEKRTCHYCVTWDGVCVCVGMPARACCNWTRRGIKSGRNLRDTARHHVGARVIGQLPKNMMASCRVDM